MSGAFLLDVNVLLALTDELHMQHHRATDWFDEGGVDRWATCAITQAGFIRLKTNPKVGGNSCVEGAEALRRLVGQPGHRFWPMGSGWLDVTERFAEKIFGHQQVTDAYLLGLAVEQDGVLVTMDKGMRFLAGTDYARNLLVLE